MKADSNFSQIVIIYNPNSTGDAPEIAKRLERTLKKRFPRIATELQATERAGHAYDLAYQASKTHAKPLIVSVSGDGGYHEVINGTLAAIRGKVTKHPVVTVVGAGNANDHYRATNRLPLTELIAMATPRPMDLLEITITNSRGSLPYYAHSYAGVGISPRVAQELNKYKLNLFKETYIIGKTIFSLRPVSLEQNGKVRRADSLIFANIREMAKVLTISDKTNIHDGKFELVEIPHRSLVRLIVILAKAAVWSLGAQQHYSQYEFKVCEDTPFQIDGEVIDCHNGDTIRVAVAKDAITTLY